MWVWCAVKVMLNAGGVGRMGEWRVPFYFHMPVKKKDRVSEIVPCKPSFCIWGNGGQKRELVEQAVRGRAAPPPDS